MGCVRKSASIPLFAQIPQNFKNEHIRLCWHGAKWLVSVKGCAVSITECGAGGVAEMPDVIGWQADGECFVLECKSSRSDFLRDKKKKHRSAGMGRYRLFLTPPDMVKADELPEGWGLANLKGERIIIVKCPSARISNTECERLLMLSCLKHPQKLLTKARYHDDDTNAYYNRNESPSHD